MDVNESQPPAIAPSEFKAKPLVADGSLPMPRSLLTAGIELDPHTEREREARMETLKGQLHEMMAIGNGAAVIDRVLSLVVELERENERFAWRLLRALRYRFGAQTEKLSREELAQLYMAFGGDEATANDANPVVPTPPAPSETKDGEKGEGASPSGDKDKPAKKRRQRKPGGGIRIAPFVERIVTNVPVAEQDRICALCGGEKSACKPVCHQRIVYVPARIEVHEEIREMLACSRCRKDVSVAERQTVPAVGRRVEPSLIAKLVKDKCANALPLHRQRKELARMGLELPENTIQSYFAYATDALAPVAACILANVFRSSIVGADDTSLKVLDRTAKGGRFRGHLWCFVGTDGTVGGAETVGYTFAASWQAEELTPWFSAIDNMIQCDDYAGYSSPVKLDDGKVFVAVPDERRLGCAMHVRSKFHDALLAKDTRAAFAIKRFADLYLIEAECKQRGLDADARTEARHQRSLPIFNELYEWIEKQDPKLLPKSPLRAATTYALGQQKYLRRCFEDGRFEIDNGRVERRIRPFAVGRRNFLFTGSLRGGKRLAVAYTLVDNCLILGLDPQHYLEDVLTKLEAGWPLARLSELTPARWGIEHARQQAQ